MGISFPQDITVFLQEVVFAMGKPENPTEKQFSVKFLTVTKKKTIFPVNFCCRGHGYC